jgi:hypothetical protein
MSIFGDMSFGGVKGLLEGAGTFAKDIRSAITGEISPEKKAELLQKADELESQGMVAQAEINKIEAASPIMDERQYMRDDSFNSAFADTISHEGGYVNDPADPGGETKFGISKRSYPDIDIASLTVEDAKQIYRRDYWDRLHLDEIASRIIAGEIFDTAVNAGRKTAVKIAQRSLAFLGEAVEVDGVIGPVTIVCINKWAMKDEQALYKCLNGFQFMHYAEITNKNTKLIRFSRGWMKRIQQYKEG